MLLIEFLSLYLFLDILATLRQGIYDTKMPQTGEVYLYSEHYFP